MTLQAGVCACLFSPHSVDVNNVTRAAVTVINLFNEVTHRLFIFDLPVTFENYDCHTQSYYFLYCCKNKSEFMDKGENVSIY